MSSLSSICMKNHKSKKILLTTPIYYPNDKPHLGHVYTSVVTDFLARFYRMQGREVLFSTGLDEHGQKIYKTAVKKGVSPQQHVDEMVPFFKEMLSRYNISYNVFIRTTEAKHKRAAQALWLSMEKNGYIVKDKYAGWYNVSDEAFIKGDDVASVTEIDVSAVAKDGRALVWLEEECYFFKLSMFRERLLDYYTNISESLKDDVLEKMHGWIYPRSRLNEVIGFLQQPLLDVAISRTTLDWGISVPCVNNEDCYENNVNEDSVLETSYNIKSDSKHVMYVWIDALTNYLTVIGYPDFDLVKVNSVGSVEYKCKEVDCKDGNGDKLAGKFDKDFWANSVHVLGKDILRFHAVYWPAFLMAADIAGPSKIISHGWWLSDKDEKMSKSLGNVVEPMVLLDIYDNEQLRWFFLREMVIGQDGKFSTERVNIRWNELANNVGNLMHRSVTLLVKNFNGKILHAESDIDRMANEFLRNIEVCVEGGKLEGYASAILEYSTSMNRYFDEEAPWKYMNDTVSVVEKNRAWQVLSNVVHAVRVLAIALNPIVPERASKMREVLGMSCESDCRGIISIISDNVIDEVKMPQEILFKRI